MVVNVSDWRGTAAVFGGHHDLPWFIHANDCCSFGMIIRLLSQAASKNYALLVQDFYCGIAARVEYLHGMYCGYDGRLHFASPFFIMLYVVK